MQEGIRSEIYINCNKDFEINLRPRKRQPTSVRRKVEERQEGLLLLSRCIFIPATY